MVVFHVPAFILQRHRAGDYDSPSYVWFYSSNANHGITPSHIFV